MGGRGYPGYGTVYKLTRLGSAWVLTTLYAFAGGPDGATPWSRVVFGPDGSLYGTTFNAGEGACIAGNGGCGTVFKLRPSAHVTPPYPWTETILYRFTGNSDGGNPQGDLLVDQSENVYGTAMFGGSGMCDPGCGVIYELMPAGSGWTETVLYSAQGLSDGAYPYDGVVFDRSGNLYGVFSRRGPYGAGAVYQLAPAGSNWTEQTVHAFTNGADGEYPQGGMILDASGNLYGTTSAGGGGNVFRDSGTVFQLTPYGGAWEFQTLFVFSGFAWGGPEAKLVLDASGSLYGTTYYGGAYGYGSVFKLTRTTAGWTYTSLHDFRGGNDGACPVSNVVLDANGDLYGTANCYGPGGNGVVWEITP